jgi:hypothetical protein
MSVLENILLMNPDVELLKADGFDKCVIGIDNDYRLVYSIEDCMMVLMERDGMDGDEAMEFIQFNVIGSYVGEMTPIFIYNKF